MKRGVLALALCFCLCGCGLLPEKAWESVRADFDGDGVEERFELRLDGEELQLWFAGAGKEQRLGEEGLIQYTPEQQQNLRLLWLSQQKRAVAWRGCPLCNLEQQCGLYRGGGTAGADSS